MSNEINNNVNAIELSEQELDMVAGGSDGNGFLNFGFSGSSFEQFALAGGEATFAGPQGAGTQGMFQIQGISSGAFKGLGAFGSDSDE